jgi:hypothetical protein
MSWGSFRDLDIERKIIKKDIRQLVFKKWTGLICEEKKQLKSFKKNFGGNSGLTVENFGNG